MGKYKLRSPSVLSIATTLTSGDDNLDRDLNDSVQSDIEKWINESKLTVGNIPYYSKPKDEVVLSKNSSVDSSSVVTISDNFIEGSDRSESVMENLDKLTVNEETSSEKSEPLSPTNLHQSQVIFPKQKLTENK